MQLFPRSGPSSQEIPNRAAYYRELVERIERIPGVESASYSHMGPVYMTDYTEAASITSSSEPAVQAAKEWIGPRFFHLAGMRLLAGRELDWRDDENARKVAVISESLRQRLFPDGNAVGRMVDFGKDKGLQVVGVVSNASLWSSQPSADGGVRLANAIP